MWPCLVVFSDPHVHISLQFVDWTIYLFAERNTIELIERGLVEAFTDAVRLRALGLGARVIDVLDRKIQLILVPFGVAAELAAAVSQHAQELDIVLLEEWQHAVIEQIGRRDGHLAVVELGKAYLGIGVDEGLLVDASNALQVADIERILGAAVTWMFALELTVRLPSRSWPFPARRPAPRSAPGPLGRSWLPAGPGASPIHARMRAALDGLDEGDFT